MERKAFRQYFVLVLPGFVIFTIGLILPMLLAGWYSLTSWDGMSTEKEFIGIQNYIKLFQDQNFLDSFWFTIRFTIGNTIIQMIYNTAFSSVRFGYSSALSILYFIMVGVVLILVYLMMSKVIVRPEN